MAPAGGFVYPPLIDRVGDLLPGPRILLGPGPSMADPRVLRAMATPLLGQFDPEFTSIMSEVMALSRLAFQTANARTFPVSGTGRAGLEAALVSLVEPGDRGSASPAIARALAHLDCHVVEEIDVADHTVVIGRVHTVRGGLAGDPLLYHGRGYGSLVPLQSRTERNLRCLSS